MPICPSCHIALSDTVRYCPDCGARINGQSQPTSADSISSAYAATAAAPLGVPTPLAEGTLLQGRYQIVRVLGTGAFGRVYLANDAQDPDTPQIAIKELLDTQFRSETDKREAITWFKREVSTLLTLEHPNIPSIHGYWTARAASGPFYLAMDYIPGMTLETALREAGGRIHWQQAIEWGVALCNVLTYLHGRTPSFVFRDIKPSNVMLNASTNRLMLIDFGIARQLAVAGATAIGTWGYVPYEQVLGKAEPRSDLYALGALLHALITGHHPDAEFTRLQRSGMDIEASMRRLFPPVDTIVADIPHSLAQVLARATAFELDKRYATVDALSVALQTVIGQPLSNGQIALVSPSPNVTPSSPQPTRDPISISDQPSHDPLQILVCPHGSGHFTRISTALAHAQPGAQILLRAGRYLESVIIDKEISIIADGGAKVTVENADGHCVVMHAERALVRGITIRSWAGLKSKAYHAIKIERGQLTLEKCDVSSDSLSSIACSGMRSEAVLQDCVISNGHESGILVEDAARVHADNCKISRNDKIGILCRNKGHATITNCHIQQNGIIDACAADRGEAVIEGCDISDSHTAGIAAVDGGQIHVRHSKVHNGTSLGIAASDGGRAVIEECYIFAHGDAEINAASGSTIVMERCQVHDGRAHGIRFAEASSGQIRNCRIYGNTNSQIAITTKSNPIISHCEIYDGKDVGVVVVDHGQGTFEECTIHHNLAGVGLRGGGEPTIRNCRITGNTSMGILAYGDAAGLVEDSDLRGNGKGAWEFREGRCRIKRRRNIE